jgi:hypothetical protein
MNASFYFIIINIINVYLRNLDWLHHNYHYFNKQSLTNIYFSCCLSLLNCKLYIKWSVYKRILVIKKYKIKKKRKRKRKRERDIDRLHVDCKSSLLLNFYIYF